MTAATPSFTVTAVDHTGLTVSDIDRSKFLYLHDSDGLTLEFIEPVIAPAHDDRSRSSHARRG